MLLTVLALATMQAKAGPVVPPGFDSQFNQTVYEVEQKLEAGEFEAAQKLADQMPTKRVAIWWDDSKVPAKLRSEFADARDKVFGKFTATLKDLDFAVGAGKPNIRISFAESLPAPTGGTLPAGAVFMRSSNSSEPGLEVVIGLKRGSPPQDVQSNDLQSEIQFALGYYFGLVESKHTGNMMFRGDLPWQMPNRVTPRDLLLVKTSIKIADELRFAAKAKQKIEAGRPELQLNPLKVSLDPTLQGTVVPFSLQATNQGNSLLQILILPDCGCVVTTQFVQVKPGDTALIRGQIDTAEYSGDLTKALVMLSNDVDFPTREVPVSIKVEPRYRLLMPGASTVLMSEGGVDVDVFLVTPEGKDLKISEVRLDGLPGKVTYSGWSGTLADPELNEPEKPRKGYKFNVHLDDALPPGRASATLVIATTDERFPVLRHNIAAQKGIVALPEQVWMGEIGRTTKRSVFLLSRPEIPFSITKIESSNKSISATHLAVRGQWEHKITVEYNGDAEFGNLEAMLTIHTDDPKQPKILVPVRAVVR